MVQIQGSKLGMRKGYHLSVEGTWRASTFSFKNGVCKPREGLRPHPSNLHTWVKRDKVTQSFFVHRSNVMARLKHGPADLALVVQKMDSAIHQINRYPVDKDWGNQ